MAQVKVYYDEVGNTLTVWFGNPQDEAISEETGDEVILMKDNSGAVIGFEKLNFQDTQPEASAGGVRNDRGVKGALLAVAAVWPQAEVASPNGYERPE